MPTTGLERILTDIYFSGTKPMSNSLTLSVVMLAAGIGIPVMAALNAGLGARIGNPTFAAFLLFLLALILTGVVAMVKPMPPKELLFATPPQYFLGGLFVAFYVLTVTWIAPKIGVGNAIFFVLLGQIFAAAVIDHYGAFGSTKSPISLTRIFGLLLMALGIFFARRPIVE